MRTAGQPASPQPAPRYRYAHYIEEDYDIGGALVRVGTAPNTPAGKDMLEACARSMGGFVMLEPVRS